jgi:hypothetical protein
MGHETLSEQFEEISTRPELKGSVLVFKLWESSYYPAGLERHNRGTQDEEFWHELIRDRHLSFTNVLDGADFDGSLYVYQFDTKNGPIHLAQMDLRSISTQPHLRQHREEEETPQIDLSLVPRRALMPYFQQVTSMSGTETNYAHIFTVDEEGSRWSHHVHQDWKNHPRATE